MTKRKLYSSLTFGPYDLSEVARLRNKKSKSLAVRVSVADTQEGEPQKAASVYDLSSRPGIYVRRRAR